MSDTVLEYESLNKVLDGHTLTFNDSTELYFDLQNNPSELFQTANKLRLKHKGKILSFSKKAFFNIINLCADSCSYCTYKSTPGKTNLSMMNKNSVKKLAELAKQYKCVEALLITGERPESLYPLAKDWLKEMGYSSTIEYLIDLSDMLLENGLFPHTNAGNLEYDEIKKLADTNGSLGLMLENSSTRLLELNMPHNLAPSKIPQNRINVLKNAGRLCVPMTTGILVGIGETPTEAIHSIHEIKKINDQYHNIQEIIIQNFQPKIGTRMQDFPAAQINYFMMIVSLCRVILPDMNIQIPPNLWPGVYDTFASLGINDWGGISPFTIDHVNPEFSWPNIDRLYDRCDSLGFNLECRLPVYPEFLDMSSRRVQNAAKSIINDSCLVSQDYWR